jgi:two-component system, OmpR family, phosphate regulon sensor histidine kinase PhoR
MIRRSSITWPIVLASLLLAMLLALTILWIVVQSASRQWGLLAVGTIFFVLIVVGVVLYLVLAIKEINLNQRQANFIDSVTHELKSPIASIKLCLQTLDLRTVPPDQQREFHRYMLEDVQRLDALIDHLLVAARLDSVSAPPDIEDVLLQPLLRLCIAVVSRRYDLQPEWILLTGEPALVRGRPQDLEMVFTNLLDNAAKYGGRPQRIEVDVRIKGERIVTRICDNGPGIRYELRGKIFKRFFRGGSELERTTKGTGLGLFIVRSLVKKMGGGIHVHGRGPLSGATFEVELPGRSLAAEERAAEPGPLAPAQEQSERQTPIESEANQA